MILTLAGLLLWSCDKDSKSEEIVQDPPKGGELIVNIEAEDMLPSNGSSKKYSTKFIEGDKIGVFAIRKDGKIIDECNNIPLEIGQGNVSFFEGASYVAYYPYSSDMDGKNIDEIEKIFNDKLEKNSDQSSLSKFRSFNFMTADGILSENKSISFNFVHKTSMVEIILPKQIYKYKTSDKPDAYTYSTPPMSLELTLENWKPYLFSEGIYLFMIPSSKKINLSGSFKSIDGRNSSFNKQVSLGEGKYGQVRISSELINNIRPIEIGDFFYKDSIIVPKFVKSIPNGYIGLVFVPKIYKNEVGKVFSLDETVEVWSEDVNIETMTNDMNDGKTNTNTIRELILNSSSTFPAFEWCISKGENWYLPARQELESMMIYPGDTPLKKMIDELNKELENIGKRPISLNRYYWSSTEDMDIKHQALSFCYDRETDMKDKSNHFLVRAVTTF